MENIQTELVEKKFQSAEVKVDKPKVVRKKPEAPLDPKDPHREQRLADARLVKGIFKYYEAPGQQLTFFFGSQYKNDPVKHYKMTDGESYEIPLGVARHLRDNGWYPVHKHLLDESGQWSQTVGRKVKRFDFHPINDFFADDNSKKIITVSKV